MSEINVLCYGARESERSIIYFFTVNDVRVDTVLYRAVYDGDVRQMLNEACSYAVMCYRGKGM